MAGMASPRRTHRKRVSALRLSSDTTTSLPEYWRDVVPPPEYEADEDTDDDEATYVPPLSPRPHAHTRRSHRRKPSSPQDTFLDSLLERSVHALELSNALLQSSMSTPSPSAFREPSPTAAVAVPPPREAWADDLAAIARDVDELLVSSSLPSSVSGATSPHRRPQRRPSLDPTSSSYSSSTSHSGLGLRIAPTQRARLVAPAPRALTQYVGAGTDDDSIALPSTIGLRGPPSDWHGVSGLPHDSHSHGGSIDWRGVGLLPAHDAQWRPSSNRNTSNEPRALPSDWRTAGPPASPALSPRAPEPATTPAYTLLSAFVRGEQSPPPVPASSSAQASPRVSVFASSPRMQPPRSPSRGGSRSSSSSSRAVRVGSRSSSRGSVTRAGAGTHTPRRAMTPPVEVSDGSPSSSQVLSEHGTFTAHPNASAISHTLPSPVHSASSSSGEGDECAGVEGKGKCRAKAARSALRKILDEAPKPPPPPPRPKTEFYPRSPPPAPHAAASTATASVSRLFTRGGRHSVNRGKEEGGPVVGIMKGTRTPGGSNASVTPGASTSASALAEQSTISAISAPPTPTWGSSVSAAFFGAAARSGSGASTPATPASGKRISFAELPESYASSRPASMYKKKAASAKARKGKIKGRKGKGKGKEREGSEEGYDGEDGGGGGGGWLAWLVGGSAMASANGGGNSYAGYASDAGERERERLGVGGTRGGVWGGGGLMGGLGIGGRDGEGGGG
ncbi:hypothetical protein B0H11DRAFT_2185856 [Mycena galericulata]|nr:hypothetical protein B0H11DRAFT_2185856 [Mycena galericulata]